MSEAAPILVAGALIVKGRNVLLGHRAPHRRICPNTWDMIGGHLEPQETVEAALVRELLEEIGVAPLHFVPITVIDFSEEAGRPVLFHMFRVDALSGEPRLANNEHTALCWYSLNDACALPDLASPRYPAVFRLAFEGL